MRYINSAHQEFYETKTASLGTDCVLQSLLYLIGLTEITRENFHKFYNRDDGSIQPQVLSEPWQTPSTLRLTRLVLNLHSGISSDLDEETGETRNTAAYAVNAIFCCDLAPYFAEAVRLRFPEYY